MTMGNKILVLHPVYAGSHIYAIRTLLDELVQRGHQVLYRVFIKSGTLLLKTVFFLINAILI